jgi:hypothetical protein
MIFEGKKTHFKLGNESAAPISTTKKDYPNKAGAMACQTERTAKKVIHTKTNFVLG